MTTFLDQILGSLIESKKSGHEPQIILVHPHIHEKLVEEAQQTCRIGITTIQTLYGCNYIITPKVVDFFIVDNRSWTEQKW